MMIPNTQTQVLPLFVPRGDELERIEAAASGFASVPFELRIEEGVSDTELASVIVTLTEVAVENGGTIDFDSDGTGRILGTFTITREFEEQPPDVFQNAEIKIVETDGLFICSWIIRRHIRCADKLPIQPGKYAVAEEWYNALLEEGLYRDVRRPYPQGIRYKDAATMPTRMARFALNVQGVGRVTQIDTRWVHTVVATVEA